MVISGCAVFLGFTRTFGFLGNHETASGTIMQSTKEPLFLISYCAPFQRRILGGGGVELRGLRMVLPLPNMLDPPHKKKNFIVYLVNIYIYIYIYWVGQNSLHITLLNVQKVTHFI